MHFKCIAFLIPLSVSASLCLALVIYSLVHRKVLGALELAYCSAIGLIWSAANALELSGVELSTKLFWANIQYIAYACAPVAWFLLVRRFSGKEPPRRQWLHVLMLAIPATTILLVWLDPWLGLVRHSFSLEDAGGFSVIVKDFGPWFYVHYIYTYFWNILSLAFLIRAVLGHDRYYRFQALPILLGLSLIFISNVLYTLGLGPNKQHDITPAVFGLSAIILWMGIYRIRLFKLIPITRSAIFERMANGMMVFDGGGRLIDSNAATQHIFALGNLNGIGRTLAQLIPECADVGCTEIRRTINGAERFFELALSGIDDDRYADARVLISTDITDLRKARNEILRQHGELAAAREREKVARDLHDNLGQILSFAVIQSEAALGELQNGNGTIAESHLARLKEILSTSHTDLRNYVHNLRENECRFLNIGQLVEKEIADFRLFCDIPVNLTMDGNLALLNLSPFEKDQLVRILKEALNNVAKHAHATGVVVSCSLRAEQMIMTMEDNGIGIARTHDPESTGAGLEIMRERSDLLKGTLRISGGTDGGTRLELAFPIERRGALESTHC